MIGIVRMIALAVVAAVPPTATEIGACEATHLDDVRFLVGEWRIEDRSDPAREAGRSVVTVVAGGCALQESITYPDGYEEVRLLASDPATGIWQLAIVDPEHGNMLFLEGHVAERRLEFITTHQRGNAVLVDRVSFIERERGWLLRIESAPGYAEPWRLIQEVVYS